MKTHVMAACFAATAAMTGAVLASETVVEGVAETEFVEVPAVEPKAPAKIEAMAKAETGAKPIEGFLAKLTPEERAATGLGKLSAEQLAVLTAQVEKEVKLARQGDVTGFAGTFISRRTEAERTAAGLGILSTSEKYQLDRLVSRALAARPPQPPVLPGQSLSGVELLKPKSPWETHGFVQLEYGFGSGDSEYKAATVAVAQVNTKTGTVLEFAYTVAEATGYLSRWNNYSMGVRGRPFGPWRY
jgi:hypothetical protein